MYNKSTNKFKKKHQNYRNIDNFLDNPINKNSLQRPSTVPVLPSSSSMNLFYLKSKPLLSPLNSSNSSNHYHYYNPKKIITEKNTRLHTKSRPSTAPIATKYCKKPTISFVTLHLNVSKPKNLSPSHFLPQKNINISSKAFPSRYRLPPSHHLKRKNVSHNHKPHYKMTIPKKSTFSPSFSVTYSIDSYSILSNNKPSIDSNPNILCFQSKKPPQFVQKIHNGLQDNCTCDLHI